jgi:hypothetical protein
MRTPLVKAGKNAGITMRDQNSAKSEATRSNIARSAGAQNMHPMIAREEREKHESVHLLSEEPMRKS